MRGVILTINAGSSSIKFATYQLGESDDLPLLLKGQVDRITTRPHLSAYAADGEVLIDESFEPTEANAHESGVAAIAKWLRSRRSRGPLVAVGHRVVHGGTEGAPVLIDDGIIERLEQLVPLMPLHLPANLAAIRALRRQQPTIPQIACFDTTFHRTRSEIAERFAIPDSFYRQGIRRYGFHGLSYEYIAQKLPSVAAEIADGKVIVAHLGSGASLCALKEGRSIDTTMSFSALDGLPMATRCGNIDPGVLIYLMRERKMSVDAVERMLYHECGLRGLSGLSSDTRDLLASSAPASRLALDYFVYHVCRQIGALAATMGGLDAIVFTAGIGEHSPEIRERICTQIGWLGLRLDFEANRAGGPRISASGAAVSAWVIPTDEEFIIARHTLSLVRPLTPSMLH
jgi:acetate kinase